MLKKLIPLLICFTLCGCYDSTEIDDLAYVVAIGIDKGETASYKISFQYAVPLNIGSGIDSEPGDKSPLSLFSFETSSVQMASALANNKIAKITDLSHLKLVMFSEDVAKDGISDLKKDFENTLSIRPQTNIAVCKGDAYSALESVSSPLELNPTRYYEDFFDNLFSNYSVKQNTASLFSDKTVFSVPYILSENGLSCNGMVVFKNFKAVDLFTSKEVLIQNLMQNEFSHLNFETKDGVFRLDADVPPSFSVTLKENPLIKINLSLTGEPVSGEEILFKNPKYSDELIKNSLKASIMEFLEHTKQINCDVMNFSSHAKRNFFTDESYKKYNFHEKYKDSSFEININFKNIKIK